MTEKEAFETWLKNRNKQDCIILPNEPWEAALEWVKQGQEPRAWLCHYTGINEWYPTLHLPSKIEVAHGLYLHPAPQPDVAELIQLIKDSRANYERQFGKNSESEWIYNELEEIFSEALAKREGKNGIR